MDREDLKKRGLITGNFHLPYNPALVERAKLLRKNMTKPEKKLWLDCLRHSKYKFLRQRPIDHFIVDFYSPELKLVIEIDGESHFTEDGKGYDAERTSILEGYGLKIIRFLNTDVMENLAGVCSEIHRICGSPRPGGIST
ncbi:endonuclease [candidate division LCP-89 bacterium B3_LCP]|uniref:Endonuclease n=1 Tax=candidate division LCP-89 bacterium B3_LCP TaxID=2012998 RepID=A0A532V1F6_UNCL8|nr:MAG: endonuclease [candidate division LCP-89 bacterium B3_LCP]